MAAKLIGIAGPLTNATFPIDRELTIGREPSNQICIGTHAVSRKHCVIRRENGKCTLFDLHSRNGTFVNDVPVTEQVLAHGDRIAVSGSVFVFSAESTTQAQPHALELVELQAPLPTITLRAEEALRVDLPPQSADSRLLRLSRNLENILHLNTVLASIREPEALQRELLTRLLNLVPADCAAILLFDDVEHPPVSILGLERGGVCVRSIALSRTIIRRVLQEEVGVLIENVEQHREFNNAESLATLGCHSALAVPLSSHDRTAGIVYLDVRSSENRLSQSDLETTAAVAAVAGLALDNAQRFERLRNQAELLQADLDRELNMVGSAAVMQGVYRLISKVAASDSTVLLLGESGTGKELAARAVHQKSARAHKSFVALNCATFSENLLESELFGHEKGAFTGALMAKRGQIELADQGTLFLDEVGELPLAIQAKLLRVLQEREFVRLGGTRPTRVNVRVIAATNRDLRESVAAGTFRNDLWHRLNVVPITLPPLRQRPDDIGLLANYFVAKYSKKCRRVVTGLTPAAQSLLRRYGWPGNVRELENAIERAIVLGEDEEIQPHDLPETIWETAGTSSAPSGATSYEVALNNFKQKLVVEAVQAANGNYAEAARRLDVHPTYLHRLIRNFNLRPALEKMRASSKG